MTNLGQDFGDKFLREIFSDHFTEEQKAAVDKIKNGFSGDMDIEDYLLLHEDTLKPFSEKIRHHLKLYLTLYFAPDEKDYSHLLWTEEEIMKAYGDNKMDSKKQRCLKENFSDHFNNEELEATYRIIDAFFRSDIEIEEYEEIYERELSVFKGKVRRILELYLTLYLVTDEEEYNHLYNMKTKGQ